MNNILHYVSSYIDGDGCFYVGTYKNKSNTIYEQNIQIISVKIKVLEEFQFNFGGFIRKRPFKERHADSFHYTLKGPNCTQLARDIQNILVEKGKQCQLFIDFAESIKDSNFQPLTNKIKEHRSKIIKEIRQEKHMNNFITKEDIEKLKEVSLTITPTETDFPYLAGLIDSEGCFRIKKWKPKNKPNHVYHICVEIGNTKLPIMPWLVKRFGGSVQFIPARGTKKASATWTIAASTLYNVLPKIRPFLRSKKEVCDKLIEFQETILPNGGDRHSELFRALFEKRLEIRERIVAEIHQLNHKGS